MREGGGRGRGGEGESGSTFERKAVGLTYCGITA